MSMRRSVILIGCALAVTQAQAGLGFFNNAGGDQDWFNAANWSGGFVPGAADLAVHNSGGVPAVQINGGSASADSFRISDGGAAVQNGGTLTIVNGVGPDNGLWVGEFGPAQATYTMNGGDLVVDDPVDGFMVGRSGGSNGVFNLNAGTVTGPIGDTHIGLDGNAYWNQSGGVFHNRGGVQVGRFASPFAEVNLSNNAKFQVDGLLLLSDGADGIASAIKSTMTLAGSGLDVTAQGLILRSKAELEYVADPAGISTMVLGNAPFEIASDPFGANLGADLIVDLSAYSSNGPVTLIDSAAPVGGTFNGLPEGAVVPGSNGRTITYVGGSDGFDIVLLPEPTSLLLSCVALILIRRR